MVTTNPTNRIATFAAIGTPAVRGDDSRSALKRGNLDFDVKLVPMKNPLTGEVITEGKDAKYFGVCRDDTNDLLGIVEGRYTLIPNRNIFDIGDAMAQEDGAIITRVSALDNGARCFMNLEWPRDKSINVVGDIVGRQAIIQNAHNGKFSSVIRLIPMRLACINGMVVPIPAFSFEFRIKHTFSADARLAEARRIMAGASKYFDAFGKVANQMARTKVTQPHAKLILKTIPELAKTTDGAEKKLNEIFDLFDGGQVNARHESVNGTAWGLLNAVAEHADHSSKVRKTGDNSAEVQRFKSGFEGTSQRLKLSAYESILADKDLGLGAFAASLN